MLVPLSILAVTLYMADNVVFFDKFKFVLRTVRFKWVFALFVLHNIIFWLSTLGWSALVYSKIPLFRPSSVSTFVTMVLVRNGLVQAEAIALYFLQSVLRSAVEAIVYSLTSN